MHGNGDLDARSQIADEFDDTFETVAADVGFDHHVLGPDGEHPFGTDRDLPRASFGYGDALAEYLDCIRSDPAATDEIAGADEGRDERVGGIAVDLDWRSGLKHAAPVP